MASLIRMTWAQHPAPMYRPPANQVAAPSPRIPAQGMAAASPRQPVVARGAMPEESVPRKKLVLPSPEAFGLKTSPSLALTVPATPLSEQPIAAVMDWTGVRQELHRLGARSFQLENQADGRHRFACQVPRAGGQMTLVEVLGQTEEEAIRLGLERANGIRYGS